MFGETEAAQRGDDLVGFDGDGGERPPAFVRARRGGE